MKRRGVFRLLAMHFAEAHDGEVRISARKLIAFFEPALILVMGFIIGAIVVPMPLAIFGINDMPL